MVASWRQRWKNCRWKNSRWNKTGALVLAFLGALIFAYSGTWTPAASAVPAMGAGQAMGAERAKGQESPLATPPPAFAPVVLPSISGVIGNEEGEPLAGLVVTAYRRQQASWTPARQTTTNAAGEYRFPWMPAGSYRLYIRDPQGIYASTYYPDAGDIETASDIILTGASLADVDAAISEGGQITGTLSWPDGPMPFDSTIELYYVTEEPITTRLNSSDDLSLPPELRLYRLVEVKSFTETLVSYDFTGLAAGSYRVCAEVIALHSTLDECFDDASLGIHGTDVVVATGATVADVAIEFGDGADLATLIGTVTLAGGTPAIGVEVEVIPDPKVDFFAAPQPKRTITDDGGLFHVVELPFGRYVIRFVDTEGAYLPGDYRATDVSAIGAEQDVSAIGAEQEEETEATVLAIDRNDEITMTAVVEAAGQITGNVTIDGAIAGMNGQVTAFYMGEEGWATGGSGTIVAATGVYTVAGLRGGSYRLQYSVEIPAAIFYGDPGATLETAAEVPVVTGTIVGGINMDLTPYIAGVAYGMISGLVLVENAPQPNMQVMVYDAAFDCCIAPPPLITTQTDGEGRFTIGGLSPGRYKVGVGVTDQPYPTLYAPDQRTFETATIYMIGNPADGTSRQAITDVNIAIGATGSVARAVRRPDDTPVIGATVNLYQKLGDPGNWPLVASTLTDDEGQYAFTGLGPDIYQVCIVAVGIAEPSCGGRGGQGLGLDVVVTAGQEATGIDIIDVP